MNEEKTIKKIKSIRVVGYEYEWLINDKEDENYKLSASIELALSSPEVQKVLIEKTKEIWAGVSK